jgi:ERCC4-type nuclease
MGLGIGVKTAENILKATGGVMPLNWGLTREQLMSIPLIGEATADRLIKMLE